MKMISVKTNVKDDKNITVEDKNKFPCIGVLISNSGKRIVMFITDTVGIVIKADTNVLKEGEVRTDWRSSAFTYMPTNTSATITVTNE
jgi:hypothetical protein